MSQLLDRKIKYDPSEEYYFLDYVDVMDLPRHVRAAYMTLDEIQDFITNNLPFFYDKQQKKTIPMFEGLRITPMKRLEELHQKWNEESNQWEDDDITNAVKEFDWRYDGHDWVDGPSESLTKKKEETTDEWKVRVQQRRDELKEQSRKNYEVKSELREKMLEEFSSLRVARNVGYSMRKKELESFRKSYIYVGDHPDFQIKQPAPIKRKRKLT